MKPFDLYITGDLFRASGQPANDLALDLLEAAPHVRWAPLADQVPRVGDDTYPERLYSMEVTADHVACANGIVVARPWLKSSAFAQGAPNLVAIGRAGIGHDKLDLRACTAAGVVVFNSPDGLTHSTASAAMVLILALSRRLPELQRIVQEGRWDRQADALGDDLDGLTLGLVGYGKTAAELVRLLAPFRMRVIAYSPRASATEAAQSGVTLVDRIETVFRESDYVSLHTRLTDQTRHSIGESLLRLMRPSAFFINVARGEIVDEPALVRCLQERRFAGAGLDVFAHEPLPTASPLLALDNVILTPHWLCSTRQGGRLTMTGVLNGMLQVARGEIPSNVLNPEVLEQPGFWTKLDAFKTNHDGVAGCA